MANYFAEKRQREASAVPADPVPLSAGENYFARKREGIEPQEPAGPQWREPQTPQERAFAASITATAPSVQPQPALQRTERRMGAALAEAVPQGAMQRMGKEGGLPPSIQGADDTTMRAIQRTPGVVGRGALASLRSFGSSIDQAVADTVAAGEVATAEQYETGNIQPVNPEGKRRWMSPGDIARDIAAQNAPGASERAFEAEMAQGRAARATRRAQADAAAAIPADAGPVERAVQSGLTSAAVTVPIVTAGALIPGGQVPALVALGGMTGAQRYGELRAAGKSEGEAALSGAYLGGLEGLTEAIPMGTLAKQSPFVKRAAEFLVQDVLGENISSAAQIADDYRLQLRDDVTMADIAQSIKDTTAATIVGAGAQLTTSGIMNLVIDQANARASAREPTIEQPQIDIEAPTFGDESMQVEQTFPSEEVTLEGDGELQPEVPVVNEATTQVEEAPAGEDITLEGDGEMLPGEIRVEETAPEEVTLQTDPMEEFKRQDEDLATDEELADVEIEEPDAGPPAAVIGSRGTEPESPTMAQRREMLKAKHHAIEVNVRPETKPRDITYVQSPDGLHGVAISGEPVAWYGSAELAREEVRSVRADVASRATQKPVETRTPERPPVAGQKPIASTAQPVNPAAMVLGQPVEAPAEPTEAQKTAGNYKKPSVAWNGMTIRIENLKGSERSGTDASGKSWTITMRSDYGYLSRTEAKDGDAVDVYMGDQPDSDTVYVIDQLTPDGRRYDEMKAVLGVPNQQAAEALYKAHYPKNWRGLGAITALPVEKFKELARSPAAKKPLAWKPTTATAVTKPEKSETTQAKPGTKQSAAETVDQRIPKRADQLRSMAARAGWQEIGGRAITDEDSVNPQVLNRTKWLAHEDWFPEVQREAPLSGNTAGKATAAAVTKAIAGEKLTAAETRHVKAMLDRMDADDAEIARLASQLDNDPAGMTDAELAAFERRLERMALQMESQQQAADEPAISTDRGVRSDVPLFERTAKRTMALGDLPRDMREDLYNNYVMLGDERTAEVTERDFYRKRVPSGTVDISKIKVGKIPDDQLQRYIDADVNKLPPIVIADEKLFDGMHRVAAAQKAGIKTLKYIDVTGLINTKKTGFIAPMFERTDKGQSDLFGNANEVKTALKKIEAEKDRRRNSGQESVETGKPDDLFSESRKQTPLLHRAYHGSPHKFGKFKLNESTVGTGEGANSYGWGLYFAENPAVASAYKPSGYKKSYKVGRKSLSKIYDEFVEQRKYGHAQLAEKIMAHMPRHQLLKYADEQNLNTDAKQWLRSLPESLFAEPGGYTYQVDIDDQAVQSMLDWDLPLDEQPTHVKEVLLSLIGESGGSQRYKDEVFLAAPNKDGRGTSYKATGGEIYLRLSGSGAKELSLKLSSLGIHGLRYRDQGSRGKTEGTRNLVVFDDSIIKITHIDGSPVTEQERSDVIDPMFRRTEGKQAGKLGEREVRAEVNRVLREFKTRPRLTVVQSYDQLPADLLEANAKRGIKAGDVRGIQWRGGIYFIADEFADLDTLRNSVLHETTVHFGLRAVLGQEAHEAILDGIARDQPMAVKRQGHVEFGDKFDWNNLNQRRIAAEEVLAYYAPQYLASKPVPEGMRKWIQDLIAKLETFLRRVFDVQADIKLPEKYSKEAMGRLIDDLQTFLKEGRTSDVMADAQSMAERTQTNTPEFERWFGDSKVVDAEGKPLVVYHGTTANISAFDPTRLGESTRHPTAKLGFWFTESPDVASLFTQAADESTWPVTLTQRTGANVMPTYLSIKNPFVLTVEQFREINGRPFGEEFEREQPEAAARVRGWIEANKARLLAQGYDGIKVHGNPKYAEQLGGEEYAATAWVAFEPTQIKSAVSNRGTFDPANPDIMFERAQPQSDVMLRTIPKKSGEARGYAGAANRIIDGFNNRFGWRYGALGRLPGAKEYLIERYKTLGALTQVREITRDIFSTLSQASPEDSERIYAYLTTAGATADSIENQKIRDAAIHVKEAIDAQGRALVDAGLLSEESYETYKDQYLPRLYLRHILDDGKGHGAAGTGKKLSDMGYLKQRKDIPEEVRKVILGEITDPAFLSAFGLSRTMRDLAIMRFLDTIATNKAWVPEVMMVEYDGRKVSPFWLAEEAKHLRLQADHLKGKPAIAEKARRIADGLDTLANRAIEAMQGVDLTDFEQIPNSPRYGALRGLYVRKEIHEDLVGAYNMIQTDSLLENIFGQGGALTKATQYWKMSKVALNVPSHFRNMMGNTIMLHLSGVPLHRVPQRLMQAISSIVSKDKFYETAVRYGLKEATFANRELARIRDEWILLQKSKQPTANIVHAMAAKFGNAVGDVYQFEEAVFKIAKLIDGMERQGLSESEAMIESHKWIFDYSLVPRAVRYLRNAPFGVPFLSYTYFALPRMAEVAIKRPWAYLPYIAAGYALQEAVMAAFGAGEDELRRLAKAFPEWMKTKGGMYLMPIRDAEGRLNVIDLGYTVPWGMLADTMAQVSQGEFRQSAETLGLLSGPIPDLVAAWQTGIDPFTGREIAAPGDPPAAKAFSYLSYAWGMAAPGFLTDKGALGKVKDAYTGKVDPRSGEPGLTKTQAWLRLFGVSVYPIDPEVTRDRNIRSMRFEIDETRRRMGEKIRDRNLNDEGIEEVREVFQKEIDRKVEALQRYQEESEVPDSLKRKTAEDLTSELSPLITGKNKADAVAAIREAGYPELAALWDAMPAKPRPVVANALREQLRA